MTIQGTVELTNQGSEASRDEGEGDDTPGVEGKVETVEDTVETGGSTNNDNEEDDDVTVIALEQAPDDFHLQMSAIFDIVEQTPDNRRRSILMEELRRVQRASAIHFLMLFSLPVLLLIVVLVTVLGSTEECESEASYCELERRSFMNAFTTRCICESVQVVREP